MSILGSRLISFKVKDERSNLPQLKPAPTKILFTTEVTEVLRYTEKTIVAKADSYMFSVVNILHLLQVRGIKPRLQNIFTAEVAEALRYTEKTIVAKANSYMFSVVNILHLLQVRDIKPRLQNIFTTEVTEALRYIEEQLVAKVDSYV